MLFSLTNICMSYFPVKAAYRRESLCVLMVPERSLGSIMAEAVWQQVIHMRARAESQGQKAHIWNCKQEVERANWKWHKTFDNSLQQDHPSLSYTNSMTKWRPSVQTPLGDVPLQFTTVFWCCYEDANFGLWAREGKGFIVFDLYPNVKLGCLLKKNDMLFQGIAD